MSRISYRATNSRSSNKLAFVAWHAIGLMFGKPDPYPETPLTFGFCDNLARRTLVARVRVVTTMLRGDSNNPQIADFPTFWQRLGLWPDPHWGTGLGRE